MKALKITTAILVIIFLIVIVIGLFLPPKIKVERSITINAQPSDIHPYVNDMREWPKWTAWAKRDTTMTNIFEGSVSGEGSVYKWSGNDEVGSGVMKITRSDSNQGIWYDMSMEDGQFQSQGSITYQHTGDSTKVDWAYQPDIGGNIIYKYVMVFFKPYIEQDFDEGLQGLKKVVEADTTNIEPDSTMGNDGMME